MLGSQCKALDNALVKQVTPLRPQFLLVCDLLHLSHVMTLLFGLLFFSDPTMKSALGAQAYHLLIRVLWIDRILF